MPANKQVRVNLILKGDLARAFEREYWKAIKASEKTGASRPPTKTEVARAIVIEGLQPRGYEEVEDNMEWGGPRGQSGKDTDSPGQLMGLAAA
jgi:hypothetical protein